MKIYIVGYRFPLETSFSVFSGSAENPQAAFEAIKAKRPGNTLFISMVLEFNPKTGKTKNLNRIYAGTVSVSRMGLK